ncbi:hypothetical protein M422DRAFT_249521 [Sphaerobolus stellatus SS14]|uniref:Ubiquitin-like protease family profile domain-containing protein n=1 Tax=Sphaerobolus stellatus (strain SS14) TaxID=990650 RepID=A0A0C9W3T9_SPHS4|nr:hypothetical protein M422DRAFT_249521 [Sphaerobolus stellatus SS14]
MHGKSVHQPTLCFSGGFNVHRIIGLTTTGVARLEDTEWYNDDIVDFGLSLLLWYEHFLSSSQRRMRILVFSTFWYRQYDEKGYDGVARWTRKHSLFDFDCVILPLHNNSHWFTVAVCNPAALGVRKPVRPCMLLSMDSSGYGRQMARTKVLKWLTEDFRARNGDAYIGTVKTEELPVALMTPPTTLLNHLFCTPEPVSDNIDIPHSSLDEPPVSTEHDSPAVSLGTLNRFVGVFPDLLRIICGSHLIERLAPAFFETVPAAPLTWQYHTIALAGQLSPAARLAYVEHIYLIGTLRLISRWLPAHNSSINLEVQVDQLYRWLLIILTNIQHFDTGHTEQGTSASSPPPEDFILCAIRCQPAGTLKTLHISLSPNTHQF